jgi:cell division septum initiation protein DivIVA
VNFERHRRRLDESEILMSVSGISSSSLFDLLEPASAQSQKQQLQQQIQQLGKDLSAGNLSAAQADFATLQKDAPPATSAASSTSNPIAQAFQKLAQDLQSGNLSAAQQDFSTIQQDSQVQGGGGHHHHHGQGSSTAQQNPIAQLFSELGQALQSGNLSAAQQAYTTLQQDFQQSGASGSTSTTAPASGSVQSVA